MTKPQMVEILVGCGSPIQESTLNAMAKGDLERVYNHFTKGGGGTVSEEPAEEEVLGVTHDQWVRESVAVLNKTGGFGVALSEKENCFYIKVPLDGQVETKTGNKNVVASSGHAMLNQKAFVNGKTELKKLVPYRDKKTGDLKWYTGVPIGSDGNGNEFIFSGMVMKQAIRKELLK